MAIGEKVTQAEGEPVLSPEEAQLEELEDQEEARGTGDAHGEEQQEAGRGGSKDPDT